MIKVFLIALLIWSAQGFWERSQPGLDEKIGQMIMVGFRGTDIAPGSAIASGISDVGIGGIVLYRHNLLPKRRSRNGQGPEQLRQMIRNAQGLARTPLLVALDYEGGQVSRLGPSRGFPRLKSARDMGQMDPGEFRQLARDMGRTLKGLGINFNLAPVVDLDLYPDSPAIGKRNRSFSGEPSVVIEKARILIDGHHESDVITALKHFPGHGSARVDSHRGLPDVTETWQPDELTPFRELIREGETDAVMTAHVYNRNLDDRWPATLSRKIIKGILRDELNFRGVVISDDLQMGAIRDLKSGGRALDLEDIILLALRADVDILLFSNSLAYDETIAVRAADCIRDLVRRGLVSEKRIDRSYRRIMKLKRRILNWGENEDQPLVFNSRNTPGSVSMTSRAIADSADRFDSHSSPARPRHQAPRRQADRAS